MTTTTKILPRLPPMMKVSEGFQKLPSTHTFELPRRSPLLWRTSLSDVPIESVCEKQIAFWNLSNALTSCLCFDTRYALPLLRFQCPSLHRSL